MAEPITEEFIEVAIELIDDFIEQPNATWVQVTEVVPDANRPWEIEQGGVVEFQIKLLLYPPGTEGKEFLRYMKDGVVPEGQIIGLMYPQVFEPKLIDHIKFQGSKLSINAIDPLTVIDDPILYILDLRQ